MRMYNAFETLVGALMSIIVPAGLIYLYATQPGGLASMTGIAIAFWLLSATAGVVGFIGSVTKRSELLSLVAGTFATQGLLGLFSVSVLLLPAALTLALLAIMTSRRIGRSPRENFTWTLYGISGTAVFFALALWLTRGS